MNAIARLRQHPTGFWFVFWGELAERASYYGMRTVLALYLTHILAFREDSAAAIMPAFMAACYVAPLLGGFLADRVLGRYKTILYFSGPYILGHIILGAWENRTALFIALVLLALGSGSIKPNTSTLMGAIYEQQKKEALLTEAFSYFYAAINIGSAISTLALPYLRDHLTPHYGLHRAYAITLMVPAVLMAVAFLAFAAGKKHYRKEEPGGPFVDAPIDAGEGYRGPPQTRRVRVKKTDEQRRAERATLGRIAGIFLLIAVFWFVYDQSASTWIYFAEHHMNLRLIGGLSTTPDQIQGLNPVLIVVLTPVFNALWESMKRRRGGIDVPDTRKMLLGFVIVIACMATMAVAGYTAGAGKISVWWLVIATFVITMSELCISVVGLEFAFRQAAPGTKSVVTAAFLFTVFIGDSFGTVFNKALWSKISPGSFFLIQAGIMVLTAIAFISIARKFERESSATAPASPSVEAA
jgi:POT family proton-dependent oligopeptide transporter